MALPRGSEKPRATTGAARTWASRPLSVASLLSLGTVAGATVAVRRTRTAVLAQRADGFWPERTDSYWQEAIMPTGSVKSPLSEIEKKEFLEKRIQGLQEIVPQSPEEFDDQVEELTWQWGRHLLPFVGKGRHSLAGHKRKTILRQPKLFADLRLFKPLVMKYPTLVKKLNWEHTHIEDRRLEIRGEWIENEEKIAGFTYEDFVKVTKGDDMKSGFEVGDTIDGEVKAIVDKGAFVEVGAKTWAFLPLRYVTLKPVSSARDVLKVGETITARVMTLGASSALPGDPFASQIILSKTELEKDGAWDDIAAMISGERSVFVDVMVMSVKTWGAIVQMDSGLEGIIPTREMAGRAGDTSLVGQKTPVQLISANPGLDAPEVKVRAADFPLVFSLKNVATATLAKEVNEGDVLDAKIVELKPAALDIEVRGTRTEIRKVDISSEMQYDIVDQFTEGEEIKVFVMSKLKQSLRLSLRALEFKRGAMLTDRAEAFERAEETAKKYQTAAAQEMQKVEELLAVTLEDDPLAPAEKKTGFVTVDDEEEDLDF